MMNKLPATAIGLLLGLWLGPQENTAARQVTEPHGRTGEIVTLHVSVEQADGRVFPGLEPNDFEVYVDTERWPIERVAAGPQPLRVVLLLDVTTRPPIPEEELRRAVDRFVAGLEEPDRAQIGRIGRGVAIGSPFTSDRRALMDAAKAAIEPRAAERSGPSPIWDAIVQAAALLRVEEGRRAIVMITDGRATGNRHGLVEASERAAAANVSVNIIAPRASSLIWSESVVVRVHPERMPEALAAYTGGLFVQHDRLADRGVAHWVPRLLSGLRQEYALSIPRPEGDQPRQIEVRVNRGGLKMRARQMLARPGGV